MSQPIFFDEGSESPISRHRSRSPSPEPERRVQARLDHGQFMEVEAPFNLPEENMAAEAARMGVDAPHLGSLLYCATFPINADETAIADLWRGRSMRVHPGVLAQLEADRSCESRLEAMHTWTALDHSLAADPFYQLAGSQANHMGVADYVAPHFSNFSARRTESGQMEWREAHGATQIWHRVNPSLVHRRIGVVLQLGHDRIQRHIEVLLKRDDAPVRMLSDLSKRVRRYLDQAGSVPWLRNIESTLANELEVESKRWSIPRGHFPAANGLLRFSIDQDDLRSVTLEPYREEMYVRAELVSHAAWRGAACPLHQTLHGPLEPCKCPQSFKFEAGKDIVLLQQLRDELRFLYSDPDHLEYVVWLIANAVSRRRDHKIFVILYGPKGSGKGTLLTIFSLGLGPQMTDLSPLSMVQAAGGAQKSEHDSNTLLAVQDAIAIRFVEDVDEDHVKFRADVKIIAGDDSFCGRALHRAQEQHCEILSTVFVPLNAFVPCTEPVFDRAVLVETGATKLVRDLSAHLEPHQRYADDSRMTELKNDLRAGGISSSFLLALLGASWMAEAPALPPAFTSLRRRYEAEAVRKSKVGFHAPHRAVRIVRLPTDMFKSFASRWLVPHCLRWTRDEADIVTRDDMFELFCTEVQRVPNSYRSAFFTAVGHAFNDAYGKGSWESRSSQITVQRRRQRALKGFTLHRPGDVAALATVRALQQLGLPQAVRHAIVNEFPQYWCQEQ